MILDTVVVGVLQVNCYVLGSPRTRQGVVIDPGDNAGAVLHVLEQHHLRLTHILATHGHFDHVMAARALQDKTGAGFYIHPADQPLLGLMRQTAQAWLGTDPGAAPEVTGELAPGEKIQLDDCELGIYATPGHSPGGVTLVDDAGQRAFTGDALFAGSIGRTDLPGGDARLLLNSLQNEILKLPDQYAILPGHGPASTIGQERRTNPFLDPAAFDFWL